MRGVKQPGIKIDAQRLAILFAVTALVSVQLSHILGGILILDSFVLLLIPAFLFFLVILLSAWPRATYDYRIALTLILFCLSLSLLSKSRFVVAYIDDNYHVAKIIAHAYENNFNILLQYIDPDGELDWRLFYIDFVEVLWGVFYRWTRWDFIVVLLQALPILYVWKRLATFFSCENVKMPNLLAVAVVLSLQLLWCQQGSGYNDSTVGMFVGLALIEMFIVLKHKGGANPFQSALSLACVCAAGMVSRSHGTPIGIIGSVVALTFAYRHLTRQQWGIILCVIMIGAGYLFSHHYDIWKEKGTPFYPYWTGDWQGLWQSNSSDEGWLHGYYLSHPVYRMLKNHGITNHLFYVIPSWLIDYKFRSFITPDPFIGGRGLLWTYVVPPVLVLAGIELILKKQWQTTFKQPVLWIAVVYVFYFIFYSGVIVARFAMGLDLFLLAWCLAWLARKCEGVTFPNRKNVYYGFITVCLLITLISFGHAIQGIYFFKKDQSFLSEQYRAFPNFIRAMDLEPAD